MSRGRFGEAKEKFEKTISLRVSIESASHSDENYAQIGVATNNLAVCLESMNEANNAADKFDEAIKILSKCLPPGHSDVLIMFFNSGVLFHKLKRYECAVTSFSKLIQDIESPIDVNGIRFDVALTKLCQSFVELKQFSEGVEFFKSIEEKSFSDENKALIWSNIAVLMMDTKENPTLAKEYATKAAKYAIQNTKLMNSNPMMAKVAEMVREKLK